MVMNNKKVALLESGRDEMKFDLAEQEAMNMSVSQIIEYLVDGFEGLDNLPDIEIREEWEAIFGELKNWETDK